MKTIQFSSRCYTVDCRDSLGNVIARYTNVPANSKEDAIQLVRQKLTFTAEVSNSGTMFQAGTLGFTCRCPIINSPHQNYDDCAKYVADLVK